MQRRSEFKVTLEMPAGVHPYALASACGQGHLFKFWESLTETERKSLLSDVESIDFDKVVQLFQVSLTWIFELLTFDQNISI